MRGSLNLESGLSLHETIFQDHCNPIGAVCHHHSCRTVILRIREQPSHEAVHQLVPTRNSNRATITAACWNRKRPRPSPLPISLFLISVVSMILMLLLLFMF